MKLISIKDLDELAFEFCSLKVKQELKGDYLIDIDDSDVDWDPTFLRFLHDANLSIWKKLGEFEFILDDEDQPIGFINPFVEKGCEAKNIPKKEILEIICANPVFTEKGIELTEYRFESNGAILCDAKVVQKDGGKLRYKIRVNPSSKELISAEPRGKPDYE